MLYALLANKCPGLWLLTSAKHSISERETIDLQAIRVPSDTREGLKAFSN